MAFLSTPGIVKSAARTANQAASTAFSAPGGAGSSGSIFDSGNYFLQKYNDVFHEVDLYLDNSGDFEQPRRFFINPSAVISLVVNDMVNDWIVDGSMTFMYLPESAPRNQAKTGQSQKTPTGMDAVVDAAVSNGKTLEDYEFRGDGYDILRVMIIPKAEPDSAGQGLKIDRGDTKWMLSYAFSIYEVEDVNEIPAIYGLVSSYMKCLKVKFYDIRHHMLKSTNIEYSTAMPKDSKYVPNFNSEIAKTQGVLYTGDTMRDILNEVLAKKENGGHPELTIPEEIEKWDKGKAEIFYTSPAQYSAQDDIDYLFAHHVSEKKLEGAPEDVELNDMCLFHTERSDTFGKLDELHLTPLQDFFAKAGKDGGVGEIYKETFYVTSATEDENVTNISKVPKGGDGKNTNFKSFKYGQIMSYSFVDMSASVNTEIFRTTPVYSVDIGKREFNVEFKTNNILAMKKMFAKTYISKLNSAETGNEEKLFLPIIHKHKQFLNVFPTFSSNGNNQPMRQRNGLHQLLYTGLFQNACIKFRTYGSTLRESGTFIGIDKTEGSEDTDYSNKLFGQWFVVTVDHIFEAGAYMNIIHAVKVHRHKTRKSDFENIIE